MNWIDWALIALISWGIINGYLNGKVIFWSGFFFIPAGAVIAWYFQPWISAFMNTAWGINSRVEAALSPMFYIPVGSSRSDPAAVFAHMGMPEELISMVLSSNGETPAAIISNAFVSVMAFLFAFILFYSFLKIGINLFLSHKDDNNTKTIVSRVLGIAGGLVTGLSIGFLSLGLILPLVPMWPILKQTLLIQFLFKFVLSAF